MTKAGNTTFFSPRPNESKTIMFDNTSQNSQRSGKLSPIVLRKPAVTSFEQTSDQKI